MSIIAQFPPELNIHSILENVVNFSKEMIDLCISVLSDYFGKIVSSVAGVILRLGKATRAEIQSHLPEHKKEDIRTALIMLIQHNLLFFLSEAQLYELYDAEGVAFLSLTTPKRVSKKKKDLKSQLKSKLQGREDVIYYVMHPHLVLRSLRFERISGYVKEEFGAIADHIMEELMIHGRLTFDNLKKLAVKAKTQQLHESETEYSEADITVSLFEFENLLQPSFDTLVRHRFIVSVPKQVELFLEEKKRLNEISESEVEVKEKSQSKKKDTSQTDLDDLLVNPKKRSRKSEKASKRRKLNVESEKISEKDIDENGDAIEEDNTLWQINFDQFIRTFRNIDIVNYIADKVHFEEVSIIVGAMLQMTVTTEPSLLIDEGPPIHLNSILSKLKESDDDVNFARCRQLLEILDEKLDVLQIASTDTLNPSYRIKFAHIIRALKQREVEIIVEKKFGITGLRVFRLLLQNKVTDGAFIAKEAMLSPNEAFTLLNKMYKEGFCNMQEVPKSSDIIVSRTIYLWTVNIDFVFDKIIKMTYKTLGNVRRRLQSIELRFHQQHPNLVKIRDFEPEPVRELKRKQDVLQHYILELNEFLTLFVDY